MSALEPSSSSPRLATLSLRSIRHVALDMDGTIYRGSTLFECTRPFLATLERLGIGYTFVTNNPSKSGDDYLMHLERLGLTTTADHLYTSAQATIDHFQKHLPELRRLFLLGTPSMIAEFERAGFVSVTDSASDEPDAVVVGFDTTLTYARLCRAAWWLRQGKFYAATNPDRICPTDELTVLPDCAAICAALEQAVGRTPNIVFGKPDPAMLAGILERHRLLAAQIAMVGDRLYTDILMAKRAGTLAVLVLTGEATAAAAAESDVSPDLLIPSLAEFGALLLDAHQPAFT